MSLWHLESVQDGPRNPRLKFCQNRFSNSWDITDIEFTGWVVGGGWCAKSFLRRTQLKVMLGWIEVELGFWQQNKLKIFRLWPLRNKLSLLLLLNNYHQTLPCNTTNTYSPRLRVTVYKLRHTIQTIYNLSFVNFPCTWGHCTIKWDKISSEVLWCCQM